MFDAVAFVRSATGTIPQCERLLVQRSVKAVHRPYTGEFIWDVSMLGLGPGTYTALFAIHDGDRDRAIGCVTIVITP